MINQEIAKIFNEMSEYLAMDEVAFKPQAYEKAALNLESLSVDVADIYKKEGLKGLEDVPGIGQSMAEKIEEYIKTGKIKEYEAMKKKMPVDLQELSQVEGLGPKRIKSLYEKLKIKNLKDLAKAITGHKIKKIEGFGEKTEENIAKGLNFLKTTGGRFVLGHVLPQIDEIIDKLRELEDVEQIEVAGSVRRKKETIGDADILITSKNPKKVMDFFVSLPDIEEVLAHGQTKSIIRLKNGLEVDLRVVDPGSFGAALQYFTGDKNHNIKVRKIAQDKGYKLNEYGLFKKEKNEEVLVAGKTEEEIYERLGMALMPAEMREDSGEVELAQEIFKGNKKTLDLINYGDVRGDLQVQTNWTDGENSIEEMAQKAMALGLEYIVITDHTKSLAMTGGSDEKKLVQQMAEIDKINKQIADEGKEFKILKGAEVNIAKDGTLDIDDDVLAQLDVVGAAIHSSFNLSKKEQTERLKKAMQNKNIDIIFHPTGRIINKRPAYELDIDEIIEVAKQTGTILEIDAYPDRLDLKDDYVRKAVETGVKLSIDSDAHSENHLKYLDLGVAQARRGWAEKKDVINAWPLEKMLKMLK